MPPKGSSCLFGGISVFSYHEGREFTQPALEKIAGFVNNTGDLLHPLGGGPLEVPE